MRIKIVLIVFVAIWSLAVYKLYDVSIRKHSYYENLAMQNRIRIEYLRPIRGEIMDKKGNMVAMNMIGFSLSLRPHLRRDKMALDKLLMQLKEYFPDLNTTAMKRLYLKKDSVYSHRYIKVIDFIGYEKMMRIYPVLSQNDLVKIDAVTKRYYPYGRYLSHLIGYTGRSNKKENEKDQVTKIIGTTGKSGLERYYNSYLQGIPGYIVKKVTATNKPIEIIDKKEPISNQDLIINIDLDLQRYIYELFEQSNHVGAAVVMDREGRVLAAVSHPSYDPNLFVGGISVKEWKKLRDDPNRPFANKLIHGTYPPGSTVKMGVALAISNRLPEEIGHNEFCKGYITIGKSTHKFRCWASWGHGRVDLKRSIRESCDVFYYNKSLKVGIDAIAKELKRFALGVKTGIDLPGEFVGIVPSKQWKMKRYRQSWYMGETVISAIGQGYMLATPIQIAVHTNMLATSNLVKPRIAYEVAGKRVEEQKKYVAFDREILDEIRQGMYEVCNHKLGTAYKAMSGLPIVVAGKTGTSQVSSIPQDIKERIKEEDMEYFLRSHAWFTGYAPYRNPQYVVTVLIEHGGYGGSVAAPVAAKIYRRMYEHGYFKQENKAKISL